MNADTPRRHRGRGAGGQRTTDFARLLLRRAQLGLAVLAIPVSMTVGVLVAGTAYPDPAAPVSAPAQQITAALVSGVEPRPTEPSTDGALTRARQIADELAPERSTVDGMLAGLTTLGSCWCLLGAAGMIWRRRLDARDLRDWADHWARVEPLWSGRTV